MTRQTKGGTLVALGCSSILIALVLWPVARFAMMSMPGNGSVTLARLVNIFLSLLPIIGLFILVPYGLYLLFSKDKDESPEAGEPSTPPEQGGPPTAS